ncbi:hypothetical protein ACFQ1I_43790 [Kitasatospora arboriphila]
MTPFHGGGFDPFLHEIVEVEQADDPAAPIEVTEVLWPGLMLGELLFSRAGVRVRAAPRTPSTASRTARRCTGPSAAATGGRSTSPRAGAATRSGRRTCGSTTAPRPATT